jgi:cytochrome P450
MTTIQCKQVSVSVSLYSAFHAGTHFKNPESFVPERWLNESDEYNSDMKEAFQPYSYGPRNCLGQQSVHTPY